jgi:thioredoxin reductase
MEEHAAEVGVVGAGFAGLAAALTLRRHRHSVLVFDGGPSRNAWAREVHGYLGIHGKSGAELRQLACEQVREVGGQIVAARIARARRAGDGFALADEAGGEWRVGRLVLATGVRDAFPDIDNFFDFYGCSVHVCPHCDGYEVRDRPIAIVSWSEATLPFALKLTRWTTDITVVTDGRSPDLTPTERAELADHGIAVLTQTVRRFEGRDGQLAALRFADGSALPVEAAFFNIASDFQNDLARQLGCALTDAACVHVDDHMRTSVDRVWAVGDLTGEEQLVAIAAAQGVKAGVDIYRSLSPDG